MSATFPDVVFTDRYDAIGGSPSGIVGCHRCEGMGFLPGYADDEDDSTCSECGGAGRVSLVRGLTRLPSIWIKAARFVWQMRHREIHPSEWSALHRYRVLVQIAFVDDWLRLSRRTRRWAIGR